MNVNEIGNKCAELLKMTSFYSDEHFPKLNVAFKQETSDMHMNFEFFSDKAKVFCYERGRLVCEWQADETQVIFLVAQDVLYRIIMEIVTREENLIKRGDRNYIDTDFINLMMEKAFNEIGGVYSELYEQGFGLFKLKHWNGNSD